MRTSPWWTLNKIVVLLLLGAFAGLMLDLRYEHVDKVHKYWEAWIPIVYSGVVALLGALCLRGWERGGRQTLRVAFALAFVVGIAGFWLHNHGHLVSAVGQVLSAWTQPLHYSKAPPQLAPLAFVGLGLLGILACTDSQAASSVPTARTDEAVP